MKRTRAASKILNSKESNATNEVEIDLIKEKKEKKSQSSKQKNQQVLKEKEIIEKIKENKIKFVEDLEFMKEELKQLQDPPSTMFEKQISSKRLQLSFYDTPCEKLAKNMLGKILVRKLDDGRILKGRIVETECYLGLEDKASATYGGKITPRNIPMYMDPGTILVYLTYGTYHCFNISSQGIGSSVFLRAVEPLEGIDYMHKHRCLKSMSKTPKKDYKVHELCNGPSKLCMAFDIKKEHSKYSMCTWKGMWIENDPEENEQIQIVHSTRIGIESAGLEWAQKPLRFYILGNQSVSKRDKKAESRYSS